jgi:Na+/melibiose symporter-like transporter
MLYSISSDSFFFLWLYYFQIPSGLSGIILLIGQVADAIATPLVGILSDHGQCCCIGGQNLCNYGKRKIWHLIGQFRVNTLTI